MSCRDKSTSQRFGILAQSDVSCFQFDSPWCPNWMFGNQVDGTSESVLLSRFNVNGFPMIFHIDGSDTRLFNGKRTFVKVMLTEYASETLCILMHL